MSPRSGSRDVLSVGGGEQDFFVAALGAHVREVLAVTAEVVCARAAVVAEPSAVVGSEDGIRTLLGLLVKSRDLRLVVGRACGPLDDFDETAAELCGTDAVKAAQAADRVRTALGAAKSARRRAARQARRGTAVERGDARQQQHLDALRESRDRARNQAEHAQQALRDLREAVEAAKLEVADAHLLSDALAEQLRDARVGMTRVDALSIGLADALANALAPPTDEPRSTRVAALDHLAAAAVVAEVPEVARERIELWLPRLLRALGAPPRVTRAEALDLQVDVLGGGEEIGGSCVLISAGGTRILVDAGSRPGLGLGAAIAPRHIDRAMGGPIDAIVITHAHADHAGWVPAVLRAQPGIPVFTTEATQALLGAMWLDSAKVLMQRAASAARSTELAAWTPSTDELAAAVPYTREHVQHALARIVVAPFGRQQPIGALSIELFPAGHIVGAAGVVVTAGDQRVVVTGDVSRPGQRTVGGIQLPESGKKAQLILLESTYAGTTRHVSRSRSVADFVADLRALTDNGGRVLIPAFALGRAQEIALTIQEHLPEVDVLVDGLAGTVGRIYEQFEGPDHRQLEIFRGRVRQVPSGGTQAEVRLMKSGVVIATSGMLNAGPAVRWAQELLPDSRAGLMVVGYQDEDSPGRRLLELAESGGGIFELPQADGTRIPVEVNAQVRQYGLGAHASSDELVGIAKEAMAEAVMLVHGERYGQGQLRERLRLRGQQTEETGRWSG
jgi:Cft2 family RNA processing exonuclease